MDTALNKKCGCLGITGKYSDRRDIEIDAAKGDKLCQLSIEMEALRIKKYIGAFAAELGRVDAIVFTAGISEWNGFIINDILEGLDVYGIEVDKAKNTDSCPVPVKDITGANGKVKVLVIPTNEELVIARETRDVVSK